MKHWLLLAIALVLWPALGLAQPVSTSIVVSTCGTMTNAYTAGTARPDTVDVNGNKCTTSSGGSGGGAVYGPTANGSPAANPPVLGGGTIDGTATGAVGNLKVDSVGSTYPKPFTTATTNDSSTVTTGGTFQAVAALSATRLSVDFVNISGNGDKCYIYFGTIGSATTNNSIPVVDGQEYIRTTGVIPSDAFNITCATTGDHFYAAVQ